MGEILRAVLESECLFSRPKFYGARMVIPSSTQLGLQRSTITTFDRTGWFLLTSFYVGSTNGGLVGSNGFGLTSFSNNMSLQDVQTGKFLYKTVPPVKAGPVGTSLGSFATSQVELTEYPLFGPGERIRWIYTLGVFLLGSPGPDYVDICYSGIEYLMQGGPAYGQASP